MKYFVCKGGKSDDAAKAAASHTGSLMGDDDVLNAAFKRSGVLRVNTISQLFDMAEVLSKGVLFYFILFYFTLL